MSGLCVMGYEQDQDNYNAAYAVRCEMCGRYGCEPPTLGQDADGEYLHTIGPVHVIRFCENGSVK